MKLHLLRCGSMSVSPAVPYGNRISLRNTARQLLTPDSRRVTLPVWTFLLEHPRGPVLVDTGWRRELSPAGVYDAKASASVLPGYLAAFYRPVLPRGEAIHEQLAALGLSPTDLAAVLLTHLDPDHVAGLRHLEGAGRVILPEDEYFWACRTVYKARQPWSLWMDTPMERPYYRASPLGPNHWAIDVFGDESLLMVNVPGHTDGQAAVLVRGGGRFVLLAADAAFSPRNWQEKISPGFGFDRQRQLASLRWLREMAEDPACAGVFCSHDPALPPGVFSF